MQTQQRLVIDASPFSEEQDNYPATIFVGNNNLGLDSVLTVFDKAQLHAVIDILQKRLYVPRNFLRHNSMIQVSPMR